MCCLTLENARWFLWASFQLLAAAAGCLAAHADIPSNATSLSFARQDRDLHEICCPLFRYEQPESHMLPYAPVQVFRSLRPPTRVATRAAMATASSAISWMLYLTTPLKLDFLALMLGDVLSMLVAIQAPWTSFSAVCTGLLVASVTPQVPVH